MVHFCKIIFCSFLLSSPLYSIIQFDESLSGDLSDDYLNPNTFTFQQGSNVITGGLLGGSADLDLFSFTIPSGFELNQILVNSFFGGNNGSFLLLQPGSVLSAPPSNFFMDPIGFSIFNDTFVADGTDLLPIVTNGPPFNSIPTLSSGVYAAWLNEIDFPSLYSLDFVVTAVPEPHFVAQFTVLLSLFALRRNRVSSTQL